MSQLRVRVLLTVERIIEFNGVDEDDEERLVDEAQQTAAHDLEFGEFSAHGYEVTDENSRVSWA